jgi:asparagine synthase (glutamine-hydrolysing)
VCGIAGIWRLDGAAVETAELVAMTRRLNHRGPDDEGFVLLGPEPGQAHAFVEGGLATAPTGAPLGFGHRRLSILDLTAAGHQPMVGPGGTWIVFNGEIYNYIELREELRVAGHRFRTGTDTEVILAAWDQWGEDCLGRLNGMFALALWDPRRECLFCARDRFGVKPFFYIDEPGSRFAFASEIKAFAALAGFAARPDEHTIHDFVELGCADFSERTFFERIRSLRPSHWMRVTRKSVATGRYWDLPDAPEPGPSGNEARERFDDLLRDAVRLRLRSDVPVGSCLSGGLDSASMVAVIEELREGPSAGNRHKTFTVDFVEPGSDERRYVDAALRRGSFESHRIRFLPEDAIRTIGACLEAQDEPYVSLSPVAYHLLMSVVKREDITVLLNGQGADESLAGYEGFLLVRAMDLAAEGRWLSAARMLAGPAGRRNLIVTARRSLRRERPLVAARLARLAAADRWTLPRPSVGPDRLHRSIYRSMFLYHLPSYLRYEDRNSMAFGIESRQPFLDYRLAELCWTLPPPEKVGASGTTKAVLRRAMRGRVADLTLDRKDKMGFTTPDVAFLSGPLSGWFVAEVRKVAARGHWFDADAVLAREKRFRAEPSWDLLQPLWRAVSVGLWLDRWGL